MSYARNVESANCCEPKEMHGMPRPDIIQPGSLVELMNETNCIGWDIVDMAEKINANLFGMNNVPCREGKEASPMCHREALERHHATLKQAAETLARVCVLLGV